MSDARNPIRQSDSTLRPSPKKIAKSARIARNNRRIQIVRFDDNPPIRTLEFEVHDWQDIRRRHGTAVFGAIYRILKRHDQALDCYQEVFLEAFQQCGGRTVRNWPAFLRWLAVRRALDRLRKERRSARRRNDEEASLLPASTPEPSADLEFRELVERVRHEVARLPERQGEAFWLHCIEHLPNADVAEQMGTETVAVLVHRAKVRLRELLAELNPSRVDQ
jgi:RNA polymerase sigma factor (sigma-70 family)